MKRLSHFKAEKPLLVASLAAMGILSILSMADVLVSKILLSPHDAGLYAGVATVAKIIIYATTPLMWLALPAGLTDVPEARAKARRYVALTGILGIGLLVIFTVFRYTIIKGLLGINAAQYTSLLPLASLAMTLFALALILTAIDLCRDRLRVTTAASLGALVSFFLIFLALQHTDKVKAAIIGQIGAACVAILISRVRDKRHGNEA